MTAEVIAIRASTASASGWSAQELAEVFRLGSVLQRHGLDLAISYGVSDEGDPWLVLTDPLDAEISFHIARIDQRYVVARGDSEDITVKRHLREVTDLLVPSPNSMNLVFGSETEPLELYAVVAMAIASSETFVQTPELRHVLESLLLGGDRNAHARDAQREADDRIGELARILIAAAGAVESDAGRAALALVPQLPGPLAPAPAPATPVAAQPAPRFALTLSIDIGQPLAPGQRDLAHAQSMIAGLAAGSSTNWADWHHETASDPIIATTLVSLVAPQPELGAIATKLAGSVGLGISVGSAIAPLARIELPTPIVDSNDILTAGSGIQSAASVAPSLTVNPPVQHLDFSNSAGGVRISLSDANATILGSHGFDFISVSGHTLVQIGDGGAIVTIATGDNIIVGSSAISTVNIAGGTNSVAGGSGAQTVNIQHGTNVVAGGSGTQTVNISGGTNIVVGGSGGTVVNVAGGTNSVTGGTGNNTVNVGDGTNTIVAGSGNDSIHITSGNNTVVGGSGSSIISIGGGTNTVIPTGGHDSISIGGSSAITGTDGVNIIVGSTAGTLLNVGATSSIAGSTDAGIGVIGTSHDPVVSPVNPVV